MPLIDVKNIHRYYFLGDTIVKANNGISFKVEKGEFIVILGPSGCGKSTLMHQLGLLDTPTKGEIIFSGHNISNLSDDEKTKLRNEKIGFVFQFFYLTPNLTALENVELPMILKEVPIKDRKKKAMNLLKLVGLEDRADHLPKQLSGGQRQRVAIARALANDPELILADEPTGNLDSKTGEEVLNLFIDLWKKGNTIIIVTHNQDIAKKAPRVLKMLDGKIIKDIRK